MSKRPQELKYLVDAPFQEIKDEREKRHRSLQVVVERRQRPEPLVPFCSVEDFSELVKG